MTTPTILISPGLGGSGPEHWQSLWEKKYPGAQRVVQRDWEDPVLAEWVAALDDKVTQSRMPVVVVAHSLSCALVAHWVQQYKRSIAGAFLVSPADVDSEAHTPAIVRSFSPMPLVRFPFSSIVVASSNDPYVDLARAEHFAACWGSRFVNGGAAGHINVASGYGEWPEGERQLAALLQ